MKKSTAYQILFLLIIFLLFACNNKKQAEKGAYSGSESCIECHKKFHDLWTPSLHGKAMQPISSKFINELTFSSTSDTFLLEGKQYYVTVKDTAMQLWEQDGKASHQYDITWALGGKNVLYFLMPLNGGKLQTIPLAYDVKKKSWYNNPASAIRHFAEIEDEALSWKDRMYTFNSSCYGCHVSQLSTNFDLATDSYKTTWKESGINCETCHGPSAEHVKVCRKAGKDNVPEDLKIIMTSTFTAEQHNSSCAPCHAKMNPITKSYMPGDKFFNNYNLITLENRDFYPDGRDLGENYTYTSWRQNKCVIKSDLHCVTCHTSSGRNKFADNPNQACLQCHEDKGEDLQAHTHHKIDSEGSLCINCHMPKTEFGRMVRSDHSFRPPMPEATIQFGSPNACNICHDDQTPQWANAYVKKRENSNYQDATICWAQLIKEARNDDWSRLDEMLKVIEKDEQNEVVATSLIRLLGNHRGSKNEKVLIKSLCNSSPLVRSAAATVLGQFNSEQSKTALLKVAEDSIRLVRISAANSLSHYSSEAFTESEQKVVVKATEEYLASLIARPDNWSSHYNMALFHQNRGNVNQALSSYETATRLYPQSLMPLINSSILYAYIGAPKKAEQNLRKVLELDADNEAANVNLGLLMAEQGNLEEAEKAFKNALKTNPKQAVAAYNLSIISSEKNLKEAIKYADIAAKANLNEPKYAYTLAFYQYKDNQQGKAQKILKSLVSKHPFYIEAYKLLLETYAKKDDTRAAKLLCKKVLAQEQISKTDKIFFQEQLDLLCR